jgi:hypothetical protein
MFYQWRRWEVAAVNEKQDGRDEGVWEDRREKREEGGNAEIGGLRRPGVRQAARAYLRRGWQEMRIEEASIDTTFPPGSKIGLLTGRVSGGLVDVHCDTVEAQIVATTLLPMTPMMHMRSGREHGEFTHSWYQIEGSLPQTEKFAWREQAPRSLIRVLRLRRLA